MTIGPWLAADSEAALLAVGVEATAATHSSSFEARFWVLVEQLRRLPIPDDPNALQRTTLHEMPEATALSQLNAAHSARYWALREALQADGIDEQDVHDRATEQLAESGDDLIRAWCQAVTETRHPVVLGALLVRESYYPFRQFEPRVLDALVSALRVSIAESWEPLACIAVASAVQTCARRAADPQPIWMAATSSGMPMVVRDMFIWFSQLPVEQVEPYLMPGLRDPDGTVRFGAMECVRDYGLRGEIDTRYYARELVRMALETSGSPILLLEVVAAIGEADPVLAELVRPDVDASLRDLAAATLALGSEPATALHWVSTWLADPALQSAGFAALGVLAGPTADDLLRRSAEAATEGPTLAAILDAMAGRGPGFVEHFLTAVRDRRPSVSRSGLEGLLVMVAAGHAEAPGVAEAVTSGLIEAARRSVEPERRQRALMALALHAEPGAVACLEEQLVGADDGQERGLSGALLALAAAGDPQRLATLRQRMAGDSPLVRAGLERLMATLDDTEQRAAWSERIEEQAAAARIVGTLVELPDSAAKDPFAWQRRIADTLQDALDAWGRTGGD